MLGARIAEWLHRRVSPEKIYRDRLLHELAEVGVTYDAASHLLWLPTGEMVNAPTYSLAKLAQHPAFAVTGISDTADLETRWMIGAEIAYALHLLLWPSEMPPGRLGEDDAFEQNVASIAARDGLTYRSEPPGGWWQAEPRRRR